MEKIIVTLWITFGIYLIVLLEITTGKWYQFLSFFATSALIFVAFAPKFKDILEGKVHVAAAMVSAIAALTLIVLMGYWYVPILPFLASVFIIRKWGNKTYWLEMVCFSSIYIFNSNNTSCVKLKNN